MSIFEKFEKKSLREMIFILFIFFLFYLFNFLSHLYSKAEENNKSLLCPFENRNRISDSLRKTLFESNLPESLKSLIFLFEPLKGFLFLLSSSVWDSFISFKINFNFSSKKFYQKIFFTTVFKKF